MISHSRVNRSRKYESTVFDCLSSDFKDMNNFKSEISCSDVEELRVINLHYSVCFRIGYDYALRTGSLDGFDVFLCDLSCQIDHTDGEYNVTVVLLIIEEHEVNAELLRIVAVA